MNLKVILEPSEEGGFSKAEDRWITLGVSAGGGLLVVHHTFEEIDENTIRIRIFSSRKATKNEADQYGESK